MNALGEIPVVDHQADLAPHGLAVDQAADRGELQPEALVVVEAGDLVGPEETRIRGRSGSLVIWLRRSTSGNRDQST